METKYKEIVKELECLSVPIYKSIIDYVNEASNNVANITMHNNISIQQMNIVSRSIELVFGVPRIFNKIDYDDKVLYFISSDGVLHFMLKKDSVDLLSNESNNMICRLKAYFITDSINGERMHMMRYNHEYELQGLVDLLPSMRMIKTISLSAIKEKYNIK